MADQNSYLRYKRDTRHLLYWMIHASNSIIKSTGPNAASITTNTTGQITVSSLVPMSKLIAEHVKPIPSTIYRIFQAVIDARKASHAVFQQLVSKTPDPEIEKSNISHRHFINGLTEAFEALGGKIWASEQKSGNKLADEEDLDAVIFTNAFSALNLGDSSNVGEEEDAESDDAGPSTVSFARPKKKSSKGKKGKGGKKLKAKKKPAEKEASIEDIPLESYRIIQDETGITTDYLMAVYSLIKQWAELRDYVQKLWHEVAYDGMNSAVGGAMSNVAIAMVKQTQSAIFVDFPGHDSYETVMNTITRGDPEKAQGMFQTSLHQVGPAGNVMKSQSTDVDVKEQFMIHAYQDLLDFITDFQANRSGKPTKRMLANIRDWDPKFDVRRASKDQRLKWRRAYTISWLYDLVNVYSAIVVQRNTMQGQHWVYNEVDWSVNGPWSQHRRLYGLNELASDITALAMQKPGTDIRKKILPHHVFQIQCIVDSMTVSRGWSLSNLRGHVLSAPAPAFRPRRDVDLFLDRENQRVGHGYIQAVDLLKQFFAKDAEIHGTPNRHTRTSDLLEEFQGELFRWLGESQYAHLLKTIEPSRFSNTNANGLWEYSPFLCGAGLAEALELAYSLNFWIWDRIPEPMCIIHLHNMLVKKGYIAKPVGLWDTLQAFFSNEFFAGGKIPDSDFSEGFLAVCSESGSRQATFQRRAISRNVARTAVDLHGALNMDANRFFKNKSLLRIYREAEWIPDRIPDDEVTMPSGLEAVRICKTKVITDPVTGKKVLEDTPITIKSRARGTTDEEMIELTSSLQHSGDDLSIPAEIRASIPEGYTYQTYKPSPLLEGTQLLDILKRDMVNDISGEGHPLSSLNYTFVTCRMMMMFTMIENRLQDRRNHLWTRAYEEEPRMMREKRVSLTALVLAGEDEECMQVIADVFQDQRCGWMTHIYWEGLEELNKTWGDIQKDQDAPPSCNVM
ncbi:hypothetical protein LOCC1_G006747 [Lachnellula occidentalis]|uniref:DUF6604 domain-containing protein n=1 Tax=Lachnellula occidentalis TaxID=215460 RepID=A0A8H8RMX2_9HELO|nr:hypothetical protein LOCC1_G006747 [Lachnellula occidentalis]